MVKEAKIQGGFDITAAFLYLCLVGFGWLNIMAAVYDPSTGKAMFDFSLNSTKQLMWIATAMGLIIIILTLDYRFYDTYSYLIFAGLIFALLVVLVVAKEVNGNRAWIDIGSFKLQPSEFAKFATALALAKYMSNPAVRGGKEMQVWKIRLKGGDVIPLPISAHLLFIYGIIGLPVLLILLQGDAGSAIVFTSLVFVLYREGFIPNWLFFGGWLLIALFVLSLALSNLMYLVIPILMITLWQILQSKGNFKRVALILLVIGGLIFYIFSVKFIFTNFLKAHQKDRIMVLLDEDIDPQGKEIRYNLKQSQIAIGSGGLWGKGFMEGTQTKLKYVPALSTDFIFCTIGEEHGWMGSAGMILVYMLFLYRLITIAERQNDKFARIYGYSVASILFFHFAVNIAMTIGLFPVVGIPLPFISYGGSSLWSFSILLFILLKLDANREKQIVRR